MFIVWLSCFLYEDQTYELSRLCDENDKKHNGLISYHGENHIILLFYRKITKFENTVDDSLYRHTTSVKMVVIFVGGFAGRGENKVHVSVT